MTNRTSSTRAPSVAVLLTCFNRRDITMECLRHLLDPSNVEVELDVYLVDDGSTDGTGAAVREAFPDVHVIRGTGELYWSRGMALAWKVAARKSYDYYLWLNDDVLVRPDALENLLMHMARLSQERQKPLILAGALSDATSGDTTYSGHQLTSWWHPMANEVIEPDPHRPLLIDLFSGNAVLIPQAVFEIVGSIDDAYAHGIGDYDYAQRARRRGVEIYLAPGHLGTCSLNPPMAHTLRSYVTSRKTHRMPRDWFRYCIRYAHPLALPIVLPAPYIRALSRALLRRPIITT